MAGGVQDIKDHKWFKDNFSWDEIANKTAKAPYVPVVKSDGDTENFSTYPDSPELPQALGADEDPFKDW